MTALVVQDLLGGDLVLGEVYAGDTKVGHHYWNRLRDGSQVDLTAAQFHPGEVVTGGEVVPRPPGPPRRCREQYALLRSRVLTALADGEASVAPGPASPPPAPAAVGDQDRDDKDGPTNQDRL